MCVSMLLSAWEVHKGGLVDRICHPRQPPRWGGEAGGMGMHTRSWLGARQLPFYQARKPPPPGKKTTPKETSFFPSRPPVQGA